MSEPAQEEPKVKPRARLQKTVGRRQTYTDMPGRADWLALRAYSNERFGVRDSSGKRRVMNSRGTRIAKTTLCRKALLSRWGVTDDILHRLQKDGLLHPICRMVIGAFREISYRYDEVEAIEKLGIKFGRWGSRTVGVKAIKRAKRVRVKVFYEIPSGIRNLVEAKDEQFTAKMILLEIRAQFPAKTLRFSDVHQVLRSMVRDGKVADETQGKPNKGNPRRFRLVRGLVK